MSNTRGTARLVWDKLSWMDRLLPLFIVLAMLLGILLSVYVPASRHSFEQAQVVGVSFPLAIGLIVMMIPPLCKVEWENIHRLVSATKYRDQILVSLFFNWIVCPFLMLGLAWMTLFDEREYREGIIMIGLARCIAMVLIWNEIAAGNNELCSIIVLINSLLQIVLYAPYEIWMVNVISGSHGQSGLTATYPVVAKSVGFFLGIPLGLGVIIRAGGILAFGGSVATYNKKIVPLISPWALIGLLYTIVVIFIQQGNEFIKEIGSAFRCFVPLILYFAITWLGGFFLLRYISDKMNRRRLKSEVRESLICGCEKALEQPGKKVFRAQCGASYEDTVTQAFTAASNNFELSLAVAISIYGAGSKQAIAATFGPLLEVPILLIFAFLARYFKETFLWADVRGAGEVHCLNQD